MIAQPRFDPEDFKRLRNEALDYVTKFLRGNNDEELGKWTLQVDLYRDHPYGHPDRGTEQGLNAITLDDVKAFHHLHYTHEALNLSIAGGFDGATPGRSERSGSRSGHAQLSVPTLPAPRRPRGLEVTIVEKPADAMAISLGFPIDVTRRDDDFYALAVANSYLGEHRTFNGKLMQDLRGKRGLNYGDYSYIEDFIQEGGSTFPVPNNPRRQQNFSIWIRPVPNDKAVFALRAALWELDRLVEKGMEPAGIRGRRPSCSTTASSGSRRSLAAWALFIDGEFYGRKDLLSPSWPTGCPS
jgi:zinc protease